MEVGAVKKPKIILIGNDTTYIYNTRNELIEQLVSNGYEVVIVSQLLSWQTELKDMGARLIDIKLSRHGMNPLTDLCLLRNYKKVLRKEKPDVVLTFNIKPNVYSGIACKKMKIPYITNISGLGLAIECSGLLQVISTNLYRIGVSGANCVMFQNEANKKFFIDHDMIAQRTRVRLLPGSGVSLKLHNAMEYPADEEGINFLFVARVMAEKGIDLYLNAASRIYEKHKNVMFHICGFCDDKKYIGLLQEAQKNGYIKYHNEQKDMRPFFEMAHCIVHPSYYPEGLSNVLLEAAAHCRPIITTDRPGCREAAEDGKTGIIIPIKNEDALVDALERFLATSWEKRKDMGLAGRAKIEREFDRQIVVKAYIEEIERLIQ